MMAARFDCPASRRWALEMRRAAKWWRGWHARRWHEANGVPITIRDVMGKRDRTIRSERGRWTARIQYLNSEYDRAIASDRERQGKGSGADG